jgi:hypothetical protein
LLLLAAASQNPQSEGGCDDRRLLHLLTSRPNADFRSFPGSISTGLVATHIVESDWTEQRTEFGHSPFSEASRC